jgi:hypothetical protein
MTCAPHSQVSVVPDTDGLGDDQLRAEIARLLAAAIDERLMLSRSTTSIAPGWRCQLILRSECCAPHRYRGLEACSG